MKDINLVINNLINKINQKNSYYLLNKHLNEIIGTFSSSIKINKIKDNVLFIFVSDSRILNELNLLSSFILKSLEEKIVEIKINDIKFTFNNFLKKNYFVSKVNKKLYFFKKNNFSEKEEFHLLKIKNDDFKDLLKIIFQKCVI